MNVESKILKYRISLAAEENIKIIVNEIEVFNETVPTGFVGSVGLNYSEEKL